ncbi:ATP-dependent helicase [Haloferax mediterranei ATCC 33500]|uniref:DNA 3'-5' helicase n=1 Tax=Haloferax mediterranei (strain ATCC 33500 / DSM 1411 / JCM 8866 / NBRC 14739 / NCIMB 2177 / R-4) TaxID=523841 RepID=I3R1K8_HALMT|nr:ATP-dependent helicase [Haloferax mediterranei]AFK18118.1 DNA helicase II / ATP-dependent DNA helicase PcrA [Haloferax mediterranei ATCC 33500]AHZ22474.1 ATP-dependent DNA helicase Rep [Haloferax mediterranei ATCC 33500]EMA02609.1 DNA helicase II / ATP-dependent DNA helicase PcrA [Haloferax mediterranei ATCC 33500]MDX5988208.1 ATP-dependent helicase [Haloferax mediterranei ATCC 33500]QCQ74651.1 ATP-dependent helicase [Haloferax mediterranei ATCC 33500]
MSDSDVTVTRLFGGPGSGKTTALLDKVEAILEQDGVTIRDILVVSYTRAAAAEVRERLAERLDINPRSLKGNVSTMHAKAYELLSLSRNDVVGEKAKKEFCEEYGIEFEDEYGGAGRRTARSTTIGNKVIATSQWLQRTRRDVADWYDVPFQWNVEEVRLPPEVDPNAQEGNKYTPTWPSDDDRIDIPEAIRAWRSYKGENDLVGFADMLERVKQRALVPNVDYLVIDEFQDITTLQYDVYEEWKPHMRGVLIAGDDDQVVYAWQGADPNLLLDAQRDEDEVLPNSYRLPSNVLNVVNHEIRHIDKRQEKDLKPRKEGGAVEAVESPSMLELARNVRYTVEQDEGTVMVLFRARYQMFQFIDEFLPSGIPFSTLTDQRMWTDRLTQYVRAVEAMEAEEPVDGLEARRLADMLQDSAFGTNDRDDLFDAIDERQESEGVEDITNIEFTPKEIKNFAPFAPDGTSASDMVRKVTSFQRKSIDAYFTGEYQEMDPNRVRVGTIHSAKGREADHVFMATDLTEKVVEQMAASVSDEELEARGIEEFTATTSPVPLVTDNERRVFYVGMSRARERLILLENLVSGAPTLPISVLLHNEIREGDAQELVDEAQEPPAPEPEA